MTSKRETLIRQTAADFIYDITGGVFYAAGLYTFAGNAGFVYILTRKNRLHGRSEPL